MKTKLSVYLVNGENMSETLDKPRREVEAEMERTLKHQESFICFRYTNGTMFIPITSILYIKAEEIS